VPGVPIVLFLPNVAGGARTYYTTELTLALAFFTPRICCGIIPPEGMRAWKERPIAMSSITTVTIPNVELTFDQLVSAIRQLEPEARSELAKALMETEIDARMAELIENLTSRRPADDVSDAEIVSDVNTVRQQRRQ